MCATRCSLRMQINAAFCAPHSKRGMWNSVLHAGPDPFPEQSAVSFWAFVLISQKMYETRKRWVNYTQTFDYRMGQITFRISPFPLEIPNRSPQEKIEINATLPGIPGITVGNDAKNAAQVKCRHLCDWSLGFSLTSRRECSFLYQGVGARKYVRADGGAKGEALN